MCQKATLPWLPLFPLLSRFGTERQSQDSHALDGDKRLCPPEVREKVTRALD
jgi:hypothetical protein